MFVYRFLVIWGCFEAILVLAPTMDHPLRKFSRYSWTLKKSNIRMTPFLKAGHLTSFLGDTDTVDERVNDFKHYAIRW